MTDAGLPRPADELRPLARLALPIALGQLGLVAMGLVDTAIVGRLSVDALAGTAIGRAIVLAASSLGMGIGYALEPLAAQAVGAGEHDRAWACLRTVLFSALLATVPCVALAFLATASLPWVGVEPALIPVIRDFLWGQVPGMFAFVAFIAGREYLQAHGSTWPAFLATLLANVVNALACGLLVHGDRALVWVGLEPLGLPAWGAFGAGVATSIASVVLAAVVLAAARGFRPRAPREVVETSKVLGLGLPIGAQLLAEIGVFSLVAVLAGRMGAVAASAHQVGFSLVNFTFMGAYGIGGATAVRVGHAIGAGRSGRAAGLAGILLGLGMMSLSAVVFATSPGWLMGLFTDDLEVIATGIPLLYIAAVFQLFDGTQGVVAGALRGAGDVRFPFLANVGAHWLVGLPVALLLGFHWELGPKGLWLGLTAGLVVIASALTLRFVTLSKRPIQRV